MPLISGGGGGAAFNGGTITQPLVLAMANASDVPLKLTPPVGATAAETDQIEVYDDASNLIGYWDAGGDFHAVSAAAITSSAIDLTNSDGAGLSAHHNANTSLQAQSGKRIAMTITGQTYTVYVGGSGHLEINAHGAPSDLVAGELALWFDQTDGASALKISAKTANGTAATATIPLT